MQKLIAPLLLAAAASAWAQSPAAPVTVQGAWARPSVQGQSGTGAFMTLTAKEPLALVGVSTPVAGIAEVHEMKMEGDVMKMRAIPRLDLPAAKPVELKPGGHHLMLMDLKMPLKPGASVPVTLRFQDAKGATHQLQVAVPVTLAAPAAAGHKH